MDCTGSAMTIPGSGSEQASVGVMLYDIYGSGCQITDLIHMLEALR